MPGPQPTPALRDELVAALDHDLRTALTTVLGALQMLARPELAPADPDLAQLVSSALAQAQRLHRLLDELPGAVSPERQGPLAAAELVGLIRAAVEAGGATEARVEVPDDLPPVPLSGPGLRRALTGILARVPGRPGARVTVAGDGSGYRLTVTTDREEAPSVPRSVAGLVAAMGGYVETAADSGRSGLSLVFPADGDPPGD